MAAAVLILFLLPRNDGPREEPDRQQTQAAASSGAGDAPKDPGEGGVNGMLAPRNQFSNYAGLRIIRFGGSYHTEGSVDMQSMFSLCGREGFQADVETLDTSSVTDMGFMFFSCGAQTLDLSNFDTADVTHMDYMFYSCHNRRTCCGIAARPIHFSSLLFPQITK